DGGDVLDQASVKLPAGEVLFAVELAASASRVAVLAGAGHSLRDAGPELYAAPAGGAFAGLGPIARGLWMWTVGDDIVTADQVHLVNRPPSGPMSSIALPELTGAVDVAGDLAAVTVPGAVVVLDRRSGAEFRPLAV